jgi:hypothetical protein
MILRPYTPCTVTPTGGYDLYGQELPGISYTTKCAVVKIQDRTVKTAVRADSSATRGAADEVTIDARLLFVPSITIDKDYKIEILGLTLRVVEVMPRIGLHGKLDHFQVDAVIWQ